MSTVRLLMLQYGKSESHRLGLSRAVMMTYNVMNKPEVFAVGPMEHRCQTISHRGCFLEMTSDCSSLWMHACKNWLRRR